MTIPPSRSESAKRSFLSTMELVRTSILPEINHQIIDHERKSRCNELLLLLIMEFYEDMREEQEKSP